MKEPAPRLLYLSRCEGWWLLAIVLVGLVLRIFTVFVLDIKPESDYLAYQTMARNLIDGKGIIDNMGNLAMYNVGYPLLVLFPLMILFGFNGLLAFQIWNALMGTLSVSLCHAVAHEVEVGPAGRLLSAAMFALYVPSWIYAEYLAKENLMTPLMLGIVWCMLRSMRNPSVAVAVTCGVLFGLLALTGNAGLILAPVAVIALLLAHSDLRAKLVAFTVALAISSAIIMPWMVRNAKMLGAAILNTNGGFNLYLGNNPSATGLFVSIADTPRGPTWASLRQLGEVEASEILKEEAFEWIWKHPTQFSLLALRKAVLFWTPPVHAGKGPSSKIEMFMRYVWLLQFLFIIVAAIASIFSPKGRTNYSVLLWLAIAAYTAVHMIFYVVYRYREPIMPLVCVLAALMLDALWNLWARSSFKLQEASQAFLARELAMIEQGHQNGDPPSAKDIH